MPNLLQYLSDRYFSILTKSGSKSLSEEEEQFVVKEVTKEGVSTYFHKKLMQAMSKDAKSTSTEHMLVANPSQWPRLFESVPLDCFGESSMHDLLNSDVKFVVRKSLFDRQTAVSTLSELAVIERDSRFERGFSNMAMTKEKTLNFSLKMINKDDFPSLFAVAVKLSSIPFELNGKIKYGFQVSEQYRCVVTGSDFEYADKLDGTDYINNDAGICLTVVVGLEQASNKAVGVKVAGSCVELGQGDALIIKSRKAGAYSMIMRQQKSFALVFWVYGPYDLNNRLF